MSEMKANRDAPGFGKRFPEKHIVRIVVVPPPAAASGVRQSHGAGQSHGLTKDALSAAEQALTTMPAPPAGAPPVGVAPGSPEPANMFEVLKPTDIVVVGRNAASVLTVDGMGKPVSAVAAGVKPTRKLFAHDAQERNAVLRVWTESDTIEYQCDQDFKITKVERAGWKVPGAPANPFGGRPPYEATKNKAGVWVLTSDILPPTANNQQYKMTFEIDGQEIDPDVICGDPPPEP